MPEEEPGARYRAAGYGVRTKFGAALPLLAVDVTYGFTGPDEADAPPPPQGET